MWLYGLDWAGPGQRQVADACECGNEPSGSVKCGEFLDQLQTSQLLKKDFAPWIDYYYYLLQLNFQSLAVVLTLVTSKNKYT